MVRPDAETEEGDGSGGIDHHRVAEERLARKDRKDLGHDAERRQNQDINLRMSEDPEEMLPKERITTGGGFVKPGAREAVEAQEEQRHRDGRKGEDDQQRNNEGRPGKDGHTHHLHSWATHIKNGDDEVE